jgi:hypothetical protein
MKTDDGGRIVISKDNYVIDGHHLWAAAAMLNFEDSSIKLPVIRVDMNHKDLIDVTLAWNKASGIQSIGLGQENPDSTFKKWAEFDYIIAKSLRSRTIVRFQPGLKPIIKHQSHDQSSHGNWASGSKTNDITSEMANYFVKTSEEFTNSEGRKEIVGISGERSYNQKAWGNPILQIVAKKQGFDGKPKVVSAEEITNLEKQGWTIAYRGIQDYSYNGVDVTTTAKQLGNEFKNGDYFAGEGTNGSGIYLTPNIDLAKMYAKKNGVILKVAVPPNSYLDENDFHKEVTSHRETFRSNKISFWGSEDLGVSLASKGYRGARVNMNIGDKFQSTLSDVFVIWDRSMLVVEGDE